MRYDKRKKKYKKNNTKQESKDKKRFLQLLICLFIAAFVFVGKGEKNGVFHPVISRVNDLLFETTDFRGAFSNAGKSLSEGEPFVETFGVFIDGVLGTEEDSNQDEEKVLNDIPEDETNKTQESELKLQNSTLDEQNEDVVDELIEDEQEEASEDVLAECVVPVVGPITSGFGKRIHPISGEWTDHNGVDIVAEENEVILSFADGIVDYIGESPVYGKYIQIKHDNHIQTFYAHCHTLLAGKGDIIESGEVIATVGKTGEVTGPHLHFEVKQDGQRVDPEPYLNIAKYEV